MSYAPFSRKFVITDRESKYGSAASVSDTDVAGVVSEFGGCTFNHGLYRVLSAEKIEFSKIVLEQFYPGLKGRIVPFGFDWLGRYFAVDKSRTVGGLAQVVMIEVGAGEAMQIPADVAGFHNMELVEYANEALASNFWDSWRVSNKKDLKFSECVGYKVPLFLGGRDDLDNLEIIDLDVYVEICGQLRSKVKALLPGQTIRQISIA